MLSEEEKVYILINYNLKTLGKLSEEMKRSRHTIYSFYKKWIATKTIRNLKNKCGRKSKLNAADSKRIEMFIEKHPHSNVREITQSLKLNCSNFPVRKVLKKLGFKNLRFKFKPILTESHRSIRLAYARKYSNWTVRQWKKVLFSDESSVQVGKIYPTKIWMRPENRFKPGFYLPKKQDYGKRYVKVWSCFGYSGVGTLHFVDPTKRWSRHVYKQILNQNLIRDAKRLIGRDFIFQEDGDKVHHSKVCQTWKRKNKIQLLDWPVASGDISPIENLWFDFKRRLYKENQPHNIEQFKLLAERIWKETKVSTCQSLIESMPRRLQAVIKNDGWTTKY